MYVLKLAESGTVSFAHDGLQIYIPDAVAGMTLAVGQADYIKWLEQVYTEHGYTVVRIRSKRRAS